VQYVEARQQRIQADAQLLDALWRLERAAPGALPGLNPIEPADIGDLPIEPPMDDPYRPDVEPGPEGATEVSTREEGGER